MKRILHTAFIGLSLLAAFNSVEAQNNLYWKEGFTNNGTVTSDPGTGSTVYNYTGDAGTWTFYGVWTTTGTGCDAPGVSGTSRHIRSTSAALGTGTATIEDDTAYVITPAVSNGIQEFSLLRSRSNRRMTIWTSADELPTTSNWVLKAVIPKWAGQTTCNDTTLVINDLNAKQLRIRFEALTNSDIDSIRLTSVTALPVTFGSFSAAESNGKISVNWNIFTEENTAQYEVERSADGRSFTTAGTVVANKSKAYSFIDVTPLRGVNYYRIRAVDKDGSAMYSSVVRVVAGGKAGQLTVTPNPVRGNQMNVQLGNLSKGTYSLNLYNATGQRVYTRSVNHEGGSASYQLQLSSAVRAGVYNLQLNSDGVVINKKVVVE